MKRLVSILHVFKLIEDSPLARVCPGGAPAAGTPGPWPGHRPELHRDANRDTGKATGPRTRHRWTEPGHPPGHRRARKGNRRNKTHVRLKPRPPPDLRNFGGTIAHDTNTKHDFLAAGIHSGLAPPKLRFRFRTRRDPAPLARARRLDASLARMPLGRRAYVRERHFVATFWNEPHLNDQFAHRRARDAAAMAPRGLETQILWLLAVLFSLMGHDLP